MPLTATQVASATGATLLTAAQWLPHLTRAMQKYSIDTPLRQAAFLAQIGIESGGLRRLEENLNYTAARISAVWPRRYPTPSSAASISNNPQGLANAVYGGRMGNTSPGDGYKYRGRGLKQLTGKSNYIAYAKASGLDVVNNPDLLLQPVYAADSAAWFWSANNCSKYADARDYKALTQTINGGLTGYADRVALTEKAIRAIVVC